MPIKTTHLTAFARDESGAVAVIVALLLTVLLGFVALGVDVASLYNERSKLQADSDLIAMSSVAEPDKADERALHALSQNGRGADTLFALQQGRFLRNPALPREERFIPLDPGSPGINATAVTLRDAAPLHFAKIFSSESSVHLARTATAIRTGAASFSLDSNIARLDQSSLNTTLSQRFDTSVTLTAGDLNVLSETSVNVGDLLAELARASGSVSRNPAAILDADTDGSAVLAALQNVLPAAVSQRLVHIASGSDRQVLPVAAVISGIDSALGLAATEFAAQMEISALDVLNAVAKSDGFTAPLSVASAVGVPDVLSVTTRLAVGEPAAQSGWLALGEEGVQIHRAAGRLLSDIGIAPDALGALGIGVSVTRINTPIYVELAGATATLEEINCSIDDPDSTAARFSTAPIPLHPENGTAVAALYLGDLDQDVFTAGPIAPSDLRFADILDLSIRIDLPLLPDVVIDGVTVQARSSIGLGVSQTEELRFTAADILAERNTQRFGSDDLLGSMIGDLLSPANMQIRLKPGQSSVLSGIAGPLVEEALTLLPNQLLLSLADPIDGVVNSTLDQAGLKLGEGELTLTGHHCEAVRLVR